MPNIDTIAKAVHARLTAQRQDFYYSGIWAHLLRLLAQGQPVSLSQLTEAVGQPPNHVAQILSCCADLEFDAQHRIVGMGLSLNPTPHQFQVNSHSLYTWCALDTILYAIALNQTAKITSMCPLTQTEVSLTITPNDIVDPNPTTAAISIVLPPETEKCCRNNFCDQGHFFSSVDAAQPWLVNYLQAYVVPLKQAFRVGHQVVARLSPSDTLSL